MSTGFTMNQAQSKTKSTFHSSPFLVNRAAPISVSLACGPYSCASTANVTVVG